MSRALSNELNFMVWWDERVQLVSRVQYKALRHKWCLFTDNKPKVSLPLSLISKRTSALVHIWLIMGGDACLKCETGVVCCLKAFQSQMLWVNEWCRSVRNQNGDIHLRSKTDLIRSQTYFHELTGSTKFRTLFFNMKTINPNSTEMSGLTVTVWVVQHHYNWFLTSVKITSHIRWLFVWNTLWRWFSVS